VHTLPALASSALMRQATAGAITRVILDDMDVGGNGPTPCSTLLKHAGNTMSALRMPAISAIPECGPTGACVFQDMRIGVSQHIGIVGWGDRRRYVEGSPGHHRRCRRGSQPIQGRPYLRGVSVLDLAAGGPLPR
jgi:hypothetical protein